MFRGVIPIFERVRKLYRPHRYKYERYLLEPVYTILQDRKEVFTDHWKARANWHESLTLEDIQEVLTYTKEKLEELLVYFSTVNFDKRATKTLSFFTEYVNLLIKYHSNQFDMKYHMQYMYLYNEMLLGSQ